MFGKPVKEYLAFQKWWLVALAVVGLLRIALSLGGLPDSSVKWVSTNVIGFAAFVYYGAAGYRSGFLYKQLLPLAFFHGAVFHTLAVTGILLTIAGFPNIYAAPEYSGPAGTNQWFHIGAHLTIGMVAVSLIGWAFASLSMLITRVLSPRPVAATS
jgi:hypothetical protein